MGVWAAQAGVGAAVGTSCGWLLQKVAFLNGMAVADFFNALVLLIFVLILINDQCGQIGGGFP